MGAILLKGRTKNEVYEWSIFPPKSLPLLAFSSVKTTSFEWHHRLGHPASLILKHIVSSYNFDLSSSMSSSLFCHACNCNKSHKLSPPNHLKFFSLMCGLLL